MTQTGVDQIAGMPYWPVTFDAGGQPTGGADELAAALPASGVTDLLVFSHGWNNDVAEADRLYNDMFSLVPTVLQTAPLRPNVVLGLVGVHWPSILFPDSPPPGVPAGPADGTALTAALAPAFPAAQAPLAELGGLLETRPADPAGLHRAAELIRQLVTSPAPSAEDAGEQDLLSADPMSVFGHLAVLAPTVDVTDTQGLPNPFHLLWSGAKEALRAASYYEMKGRAGQVGTLGLGPLVGRLAAATPALRVHLMGHSFGARLVSYSLTGLPAAATGQASPVKTVLLVQGAFSHFSFAPSLPQDRARSGGLTGADGRVDGPLMSTFTQFDLAVGRLYPAASLISGTDSESLDDALYRWGAVGHDGYQAVASQTVPLGPVGTTYDLSATRFTNLDSNATIRAGGPPSGAHSDIIHPQIMYALLAGAGVLAPASS